MSNIKNKFLPIIMTCIIGIVFVCVFIVLMGIMCHYSDVLHQEASEGYRLCDSGDCNYGVTQKLQANMSSLGIKSYIIFSIILLVGSICSLIPSFIFKDKKKESRIIALTFSKLFFAFLIADILIFTVGQHISITKENDSILEYLMYTLDGLLLLSAITLLIDLIRMIARKKSFVFFKANDGVAVFDGIVSLLCVIATIVVAITLASSRTSLIGFGLVHIVICPVALGIELTMLGVKVVTYLSRNDVEKTQNKEIDKEEY